MAFRPGSAARGTSARPPGTATRLTTGGMRPGSRGGTAGGGVALNTQLNVSDRPITQQGLGGLKTASGPRKQHRQVQDRTYFLGLLRGKINDLTSEIGRLQKNVENSSEDQSNYVSYEKRAEKLAEEIKGYQAELADYNTLVDKLNTDESIQNIQMDYEEIRASNDREAKSIDALFEQKKIQEENIQQLEVELQQEKSMADNMVADMNPVMRKQYEELKRTNDHMLKQLEKSQQELDELNMKKQELEEELTMSPVKQEAVKLYEQLNDLEAKRDQLIDEMQTRGTPQEEREKLLKQVKEDNQEIASMGRQTNELRDKLVLLQNDIQQLDIDIEENQDGRNQKYKELRKREETMDEFLNNFDQTKEQEIERTRQMQENIVHILEHMSRSLGAFENLPNAKEFSSMKDDLSFKTNEMQKSENTASGLANESSKLALDLQKVEQLESKITQELQTLKDKNEKMLEELETYSDLDQLKLDAESKKKKLATDKVLLHRRREVFKQVMQHVSAEYEAMKTQLNENETFSQLANLERKWQHHESNNFVMKEFIATKTMESDYRPMARRIKQTLQDYNQTLQDVASGKTM